MPEEMTIEGLPSPGEPLQPRIDADNQALLDSEIQERIQRQQARLTKRQYHRMRKRWQRLCRELNEAGYNQLIIERWECRKTYEQLKHALLNTPTRETYETFKQVCQQGKSLTQQLEMLEAVADDFDSVNDALKAHDELITWEQEDKENFEAFKREARTWQAQIEAAFKQSPRLHHVGYNRKGKRFVKIPIIREIIIKDDRVLFHVKTTGQSAFEKFFGRWHSVLPYGVDVRSLISDETLQNLSVSCNRIVTVERSKRGTNLFYVISRLDSSDGIPNKVLYQKMIDWYPVRDHEKAPWCAGVTSDRKIEWYNFEDIPHVLVAGATQGGKSNHVNQMIATMCTMNTPQELRVLLVDLKGGIEFTHWKGLQHQLRPMLTNPNSVLEGLKWLRSIMEKRLTAFESIKAKNLQSYNKKAKQKLPRLVCIVDEMATLIGLGDLTKDLHTELRVLSAQGRAVGIHLLLCTQHSSVDVLPGWVKTNMSLRVSAKMPSAQASMVILDSVSAANLPNVPGRMIFSSGRNETTAQSPFITDEQIARAIKTANEFPAPDNTEFEDSLPDPEPRFGRMDAIKIALERCQGRLSAARIHEVVGNEIASLREIRAIMKQAVKDIRDDGGIRFDGLFYEMRKERNYHVLEIAEPQAEPEIPENQGLEPVNL